MKIEFVKDNMDKKLYSDELQEFIRDNSLLSSKVLLKDKIKQFFYCTIDKMRGSLFWDLLTPVKMVYHTVIRCRQIYEEEGLKYAIKSIGDSKRRTRKFVDSCMFNTQEYEKQKKVQFPQNIKFSILVPLYNTPDQYLREMIDSVVNQTYSNWELCLADASDDKHDYVGKICSEYEKNDRRIVYKKLEKNLGISGNTNEAISMSIGEYIALFDHDDILCPNALYENMKIICEKNADFVYSDEVTFLENNIYDIVSYHFKPDFAIDNLRANNYICHFSVFKKSLLEEVGLFDSKCDGSQDHDMILRLTEKAKCIEHISKVIYFWRSHKNSVAQNINSKRYAIDAGILAVTKHLQRVGLKGKVECSPVFPAIYRIRYNIDGHPLISIVIVSKNDLNSLAKCVDSILRNSTYKNYEIVIVNNGTAEKKQKEYYRLIDMLDCVKVCNCDGNITKAYNYGVSLSNGQYVVFLKSMISVMEPEWMEELLMYAQRSDVGAVGAKVYNLNDTVRECGLIIGCGEDGIAMRSHEGVSKTHGGYMGRLFYAQNVSAVSDLCMMIEREKFEKVNGFDECYIEEYYDVDLCLNLQMDGYHIIVNPFSVMNFHNRDSSKLRYGDVKRVMKKYEKILKSDDRYYNVNLMKNKSWIINVRRD